MFGYSSKENTLLVYGKVIGKKRSNDKKYSFVLNIEILRKHYSLVFFDMQVSRSHPRGEIDFSEKHFKLLPVPKSNLFVVVENQRYFNNQETCCSVGYIQTITSYMQTLKQ